MKLFSNKFFLLFIAIAFVGSIIYLLSLGEKVIRDPKKTESQSACDSISTPFYCDVKSKVLSIGDSKWDKFAFARQKNYIEQNRSNGSLNNEQATELFNLLQSSYLRTLGNAIRDYCSTSATYNASLTSEFKQELTLVPEGDAATKTSLSNLLTIFYNATQSIPNQIRNYLTSGEFSQEQNRQLNSQIAAVEQTAINNNTKVMEVLRAGRTNLGKFEITYNSFAQLEGDTTAIRGLSADELRRICSTNGILNTQYYSRLKSYR